MASNGKLSVEAIVQWFQFYLCILFTLHKRAGLSSEAKKPTVCATVGF